MAERLTRKEAKEKKELKAHPMQLKYEYDAKSKRYTEKYIRAKKVRNPFLSAWLSRQEFTIMSFSARPSKATSCRFTAIQIAQKNK